MRVHFYQTNSFPFGMAAAKRRLCYIKGLKNAGDEIDVTCCSKIFERGEDDGFPEKGSYNGIPFRYISGKHKFPQWNKLMRGLDWLLLDPIRTFFYSLHHIHKGEVVYIYLDYLFLQFLIVIASKIKGAAIIKETCEHPSVMRTGGINHNLSDWIESRLIMPLYDGFIVISTDLEAFVNKFKNTSAKVIRIPILVDPESYNLDYSKMQSPFEFPYIIHTGSMNEQKDSISKILQAFSILKREYKTSCKLVFTGKDSNPNSCSYKNQIERLGIENDVVLMGYVSDNEIIKLQHFAALTIIYKSDNLQTRNCFPTKLGEMLISGVPVITTTVGDAKLYLKTGVNAFLFEENDETQLVDYMKRILSNPQESRVIAKRGHDLALHSFNPIWQGERLSGFINNL